MSWIEAARMQLAMDVLCGEVNPLSPQTKASQYYGKRGRAISKRREHLFCWRSTPMQVLVLGRYSHGHGVGFGDSNEK